MFSSSESSRKKHEFWSRPESAIAMIFTCFRCRQQEQEVVTQRGKGRHRAVDLDFALGNIIAYRPRQSRDVAGKRVK